MTVRPPLHEQSPAEMERWALVDAVVRYQREAIEAIPGHILVTMTPQAIREAIDAILIHVVENFERQVYERVSKEVGRLSTKTPGPQPEGLRGE